MPNLKPLTPAQAADWLEALPPVEIKNRLLDYLRWQAAHQKILLHFAHYARLLHYGYTPRTETTQRRRAQLNPLTDGIGRSVPPLRRAS